MGSAASAGCATGQREIEKVSSCGQLDLPDGGLLGRAVKSRCVRTGLFPTRKVHLKQAPLVTDDGTRRALIKAAPSAGITSAEGAKSALSRRLLFGADCADFARPGRKCKRSSLRRRRTLTALVGRAAPMSTRSGQRSSSTTAQVRAREGWTLPCTSARLRFAQQRVACERQLVQPFYKEKDVDCGLIYLGLAATLAVPVFIPDSAPKGTVESSGEDLRRWRQTLRQASATDV